MTVPVVHEGETIAVFFAHVLFRVKTFVDDDAPFIGEYRPQDVRILAQIEAGAASTGNTLRCDDLAPGGAPSSKGWMASAPRPQRHLRAGDRAQGRSGVSTASTTASCRSMHAGGMTVREIRGHLQEL